VDAAVEVMQDEKVEGDPLGFTPKELQSKSQSKQQVKEDPTFELLPKTVDGFVLVNTSPSVVKGAVAKAGLTAV
jgi:hypothetical protein